MLAAESPAPSVAADGTVEAGGLTPAATDCCERAPAAAADVCCWAATAGMSDDAVITWCGRNAD